MSKIHANANRGSIAGLLTFLLLAMFLFSSVLLAALGLRGYRAIGATGEAAAQLRSTLGYVSSKLHAADVRGAVSIVSREGTDVLTLNETIDGEALETRIYWYDGALCEVYTFADQPFDPEFGTRLTAIEAFTMEALENGVYRFHATAANGIEETLSVALRSERGDEA